MIYRHIVEGDGRRADDLKRYFGFKRDLVLRAEHAFYYELVKLVPELTQLRRVLDESVLSRLLGKSKTVDEPRPDYFHLHPQTNIALHGEFDENDGHEESIDRLRKIAHHAGCNRVYYFRVRGHIGTSQAVCRRVIQQDVAYYIVTQRGRKVLQDVARYAKMCVKCMYAGIPPSGMFIQKF